MEIVVEIVSKYGPIGIAYLGIGIAILTTVILFGATLYSTGYSIVTARMVWPTPLTWFVFAAAWPAVLAMGLLACGTVAIAQLLVRALDKDAPISRSVEDNAPTQPLTTPTAFAPEARRSSPSIDPAESGNDPFH